MSGVGSTPARRASSRSRVADGRAVVVVTVNDAGRDRGLRAGDVREGDRRPARWRRRRQGRRRARAAAPRSSQLDDVLAGLARRGQRERARSAPERVRLGVDVGSVRVGVAASDPDGILATPVAVLQRDAKRGTRPRRAGATGRRAGGRRGRRRAAALAVRRGRHGPRSSPGTTPAALAQRVAPVSVRLVDERLSTVEATRGLQQAGVRAREGRRRRSTLLRPS